MQIIYPDYQLNPVAQERFTGVTGGEYRLVLTDSDGDQHIYSLDEDLASWQYYQDQTQILTHVNFWGVEAIEPLK